MTNEANKRFILARNEAITILFDAVKDLPMPLAYRGGWSQIIADAVCMDPRHVRNLAYKTRRKLYVPSR